MNSVDDQQQRTQDSGPPLRRLDEAELQRVLESHQQWLDARDEGRQTAGAPADLSRTDLAGTNLSGSSLRGANLLGADLRGTNLLNANLQETDLREANLKEANHLLAKQLAGADLAGTQLPEALLKFEGLETVEQISRNARTIMFSTLLACVYTWLTLATTTDPLLLTNSISSPLPIIRTEIPIAGFFWAAPLILLSLFFYFHIYLQRLWETLADLPAVFPDGSRLDQRAYPWLLNGLVTSHFKRLRNSRPQFSRLQTGLSILLGWWTVPVTLLALWLRYLPRHDWLGTILHIGLSLVAVGGGLLFYRAAAATMRLEAKPSFSWKRYVMDARGIKRTVHVLAMAVVLFGFSFGAINGIPHNTKHAAGLFAFDLRLWVPRLMETLGNGTFADFFEESISTKPANWVENADGKRNLDLIKGARLKNADLAYADARSAFLVKADLRQAVLFGADLRNTDLRRANLQYANLNFANLSGAKLEGVVLRGAQMRGVNLDGYYFIRANLQGIDFRGADLRNIEFVGANLQEAKLTDAYLEKISLRDADLTGADLSGARLSEVSLAGVNFKETRLMDTQGLTREDLWQTANWLFAHFDDKLLDDYGLPGDLQARVKQQNFSKMNLSGIYFLKINLRNFDFHESNLQEARMSRVDMTGANLSGANLQIAKIQGNLSQVNFTGADLREAEIRYSNLKQVNLQKADLQGTMLVELDLRLADLAQADLKGATFGNWALLEGANLEGADFSGSHIRNARGLTCRQLQEAIIDENTELPAYLDSCRR